MPFSCRIRPTNKAEIPYFRNLFPFYDSIMQNIFTPYGYTFPSAFPPVQSPMPTQPSTQLVKVTGLDGAKAFQMAPNSSVALFHESEDILYVKSTDGAGFPTIRTFRFEPCEEPSPKVEQYVTLDEFNRFKEEVLNAKQSVRKSTGKATVSADE